MTACRWKATAARCPASGGSDGFSGTRYTVAAPPTPLPSSSQDSAPNKRWSDQWLLEDGLHFNAAGQAWFAKLINDFIWSNTPGARTDALLYHHPAWEDVNYADSAAQFAQERAG